MKRWIFVLAIVLALAAFWLVRSRSHQSAEIQKGVARAEGGEPAFLQGAASSGGNPGQRHGGFNIQKVVSILEASAACERVRALTAGQSIQSSGARQMPSAKNEAERLCESEPLARTANIEDLAILAARNGNTKAAVCYASAGLRRRGHDDVKRVDDQYRALAPGFIARGVRSGSWAAVSIAAAMNDQNRERSFQDLPPPDKRLQFMYTKLMELGAVDEEKLDLQLVLLSQAKDLNEAERFDAENQARQLFNSYFTASGVFKHDGEPLCEGF